MKKMLKKGILLFVVIALSFSLYSYLKTKGVWIGTYQSFNNTSINLGHVNESALEFKNLKVSKIRPFQTNDSVPQSYFLSLGKYIFADLTDEFEPIQTNIRKYNNDRITIKGNSLTSEYRKIPQSLKYKSEKEIELKNKFFKLKKGELIDSVFFTEKFLLFKKDGKNGKLWDSSGYWELKKVGDYYILFTNFNPLIVHGNDKGLLFCSISENGIIETEVHEFEGSLEELKETSTGL